MRVAGGQFRGRPLAAPKDQRVRPTSDRVRAAIFNILLHHDFGTGFTLHDAKVIDLFAGTGALGIEALSRGAKFCLFVDDHPESRALIRTNVEALGLTGATKIWRRDATTLGGLETGAHGPFQLAFLDPPYRKGLEGPTLTHLVAGGWLAPGSVVVVESAEGEPDFTCSGLTLSDRRDYGETAVRFFTRG
jgi:16S rRNA (guanine966-N2)-methyltransferase